MRIALLFMLPLLLFSCNNKTPISKPEIIILSVKDIVGKDLSGEEKNFELQFSKVSDESVVEHYKLVLNDKSQQPILNAVEVNTASNAEIIPTTGNDITYLTSTSDLVDYQGEPIKLGEAYQIYVLPILKADTKNFQVELGTPEEITFVQADAEVRTIAKDFKASGGIVVDQEGRIYVGDFGNGNTDGHQILRFQADGSGKEVFASTILGATGGAFDSKGNLYWSGYSENKVHKISQDGKVEDFATVPGPVAIKIDEEDNLYVCACNDNTLRKITPEGGISVYARSSMFNCANGLAVDEEGNFYVSNFEDGRILKINQEREVSLFANLPGNNSVNLVLHEGYLYVAVRATHSIYRVSLADQSFERYAGGVRGQQDGNIEAARFSLPNGININQEGTHLIVNDVAILNGPSFHPNSLRMIKLP